MVIHVVKTQPIELLVAEWQPEDPFKRAAVLGWITSFYEEGTFEIEFGTVYGGIHIHFPEGSVYAAPGDFLVLDPETGDLEAYDDDALDAAGFTYDRTIVDPNQPELDLDVRSPFDLMNFLVKIMENPEIAAALG